MPSVTGGIRPYAPRHFLPSRDEVVDQGNLDRSRCEGQVMSTGMPAPPRATGATRAQVGTGDDGCRHLHCADHSLPDVGGSRVFGCSN